MVPLERAAAAAPADAFGMVSFGAQPAGADRFAGGGPSGVATSAPDLFSELGLAPVGAAPAAGGSAHDGSGGFAIFDGATAAAPADGSAAAAGADGFHTIPLECEMVAVA